MLVLTRQVGETIVIDNDIKVTIGSIVKGQVRVVIDAPRDVLVLRKEIIGKSKKNRVMDGSGDVER